MTHHDRGRRVDRARRIETVVQTFRRYAAAREQERRRRTERLPSRGPASPRSS